MLLRAMLREPMLAMRGYATDRALAIERATDRALAIERSDATNKLFFGKSYCALLSTEVPASKEKVCT